MSQIMMISFIMLFSTGLLDNIISYSAHIPFYPKIYMTLKDVLLSLGIVFLCGGFLLILKRFKINSIQFRIIMCVVVDIACYPYALEGNLTSMDLQKAIISVLIYCQLPQEIQVNLANINHMWIIFLLQSLSTVYLAIRVLILVCAKYYDYLHFAIYYLILLAEVSFVRIFTVLSDKKEIIHHSDKYKKVSILSVNELI